MQNGAVTHTAPFFLSCQSLESLAIRQADAAAGGLYPSFLTEILDKAAYYFPRRPHKPGNLLMRHAYLIAVVFFAFFQQKDRQPPVRRQKKHLLHLPQLSDKRLEAISYP